MTDDICVFVLLFSFPCVYCLVLTVFTEFVELVFFYLFWVLRINSLSDSTIWYTYLPQSNRKWKNKRLWTEYRVSTAYGWWLTTISPWSLQLPQASQSNKQKPLRILVLTIFHILCCIQLIYRCWVSLFFFFFGTCD